VKSRVWFSQINIKIEFKQKSNPDHYLFQLRACMCIPVTDTAQLSSMHRLALNSGMIFPLTLSMVLTGILLSLSAVVFSCLVDFSLGKTLIRLY